MKSVYKRFKPLIFAYLFFIVLWIVAKNFQVQLTPIFECKEHFNLGSGFYTSWLASLSEDIIFFGLIGFIGLVLSTKLPQDEQFNIRVDSLANGRKVGDKARKFLNFSIRKLLVYNDTSSVKIIIKSIDKQNNLAEIYAEFHNVCTNMCKDVIYPLKTNAYVMPTHHIENDYGYVSHLTIHEEGNPTNCNIIVEGDIHKLNQKGFDEETLFEVPANGAAIWKFGYSIWQSINGTKDNDNDWYFVLTSGFSESFSIKVINRTDYEILYDLSYMDRTSPNGEPKEISSKLNKTNPKKEVPEFLVQNVLAHSEDKFKLFFKCN